MLILFWQELRYSAVLVIDSGRPAGQLGWMWTLLMQHHRGLNHENQWSYLISEMPGKEKSQKTNKFFESYSDHIQLHTDRLSFRIRCPIAHWIFWKQQGWFSREPILSILENKFQQLNSVPEMTWQEWSSYVEPLCISTQTQLYCRIPKPKAAFILKNQILNCYAVGNLG